MIDQIGQGRITILTPPLNANLDNLWALVTKTIGHPLQLKQSNCLIQGIGKKTTWEKSPPQTKQVESGSILFFCAHVSWGLACELLHPN